MGIFGRFRRPKRETSRIRSEPRDAVGRTKMHSHAKNETVPLTRRDVTEKFEEREAEISELGGKLPNPFDTGEGRDLQDIVRKVWLAHFLGETLPEWKESSDVRRIFEDLRRDYTHPRFEKQEVLAEIERDLMRRNPHARELITQYYLHTKDATAGDALKYFLDNGRFVNDLARLVQRKIYAIKNIENHPAARRYSFPRDIRVHVDVGALIKSLDVPPQITLPEDIHEKIRSAEDPHSAIFEKRGEIKPKHSLSPLSENVHPHIEVFADVLARKLSEQIPVDEAALKMHEDYAEISQSAKEIDHLLRREDLERVEEIMEKIDALAEKLRAFREKHFR